MESKEEKAKPRCYRIPNRNKMHERCDGEVRYVLHDYVVPEQEFYACEKHFRALLHIELDGLGMGGSEVDPHGADAVTAWMEDWGVQNCCFDV